MSVPAGDTWGIPGPAFVIFYLGAAALALAATLMLRRSALRGRRPGRDLGTYEIAQLAGGTAGTVMAALAGLRVAGAIEIGDKGRIRVTDSQPRKPGALDTAVLRAIRRYDIDRAGKLLDSPNVVKEITKIGRRLVRDGLLLGRDGRSRQLRSVLPLWAVLVLGVLRLVSGVGAGRPAGYLVAELVAVVLVTLVLTRAYAVRTRAATELVTELRERNKHLDPAVSPAWDTYGAKGARLGAALFGPAALVNIDPAYAGVLTGDGRRARRRPAWWLGSAAGGYAGGSAGVGIGYAGDYGVGTAACGGGAGASASGGHGGGASCGASCGGGGGCGG